MALSDDIRLIRGIDFFSGLDEDQLRLLAFSAEARRIAPGTVLATAGGEVESGFVLMEGRLRAEPAIGHVPPREIAAPALLYARALIVPVVASDTLAALEPSRLLQIRRPVFRRLLDEYPAIALVLRQRLLAGLHATAAEFERGLSTVAARLA